MKADLRCQRISAIFKTVMQQETTLWLERASYDLETAEAMLKSSRYLYVAFACQQAVEKYMKALIQEKTGRHPPFTHNLAALTKAAEMEFSENQQEFLIILTQYYLNTRYVDYKQKLSQEMNRDKARECLQKTKEIVACLKKELKI